MTAALTSLSNQLLDSTGQSACCVRPGQSKGIVPHPQGSSDSPKHAPHLLRQDLRVKLGFGYKNCSVCIGKTARIRGLVICRRRRVGNQDRGTTNHANVRNR